MTQVEIQGMQRVGGMHFFGGVALLAFALHYTGADAEISSLEASKRILPGESSPYEFLNCVHFQGCISND